ncbi:MAG: hypothetical protein IPG60_09025 [Bacteroidetes bacterium]|nr:hypothetical protein [Bacteroidota bacterium]
MTKYSIITFISFTILFLISISLCADYIFTKYYTVSFPNSTSNKIQRLFYETHPAEIPIYGNSRTEKAYYCDSLGSNFYNYGMPSASFKVIELLLQPELQKHKITPIIIDVHHDFFQHDAQENINIATYIPFINKYDTIKDFLKANDRYNNYQQIPGLRYFGFYTDYLRPVIESNNKSENTLYLKGGVFDTKVSSTKSLQKRITVRESKKLHFEIDLEAHNRLIKMIESHPERKFVFVVSPYHSSAKKTVDNFEEMLTYFNYLEKELENVVFIYIDAAGYTDELWKDTIHLNILGAKKFSSALRIQLHKRGVI